MFSAAWSCRVQAEALPLEDVLEDVFAVLPSALAASFGMIPNTRPASALSAPLFSAAEAWPSARLRSLLASADCDDFASASRSRETMLS